MVVAHVPVVSVRVLANGMVVATSVSIASVPVLPNVVVAHVSVVSARTGVVVVATRVSVVSVRVLPDPASSTPSKTAPCAFRSPMTSRSPQFAAMCNSLFPFMSARSTSAPDGVVVMRRFRPNPA